MQELEKFIRDAVFVGDVFKNVFMCCRQRFLKDSTFTGAHRSFRSC